MKETKVWSLSINFLAETREDAYTIVESISEDLDDSFQVQGPFEVMPLVQVGTDDDEVR